jgi:ATP-binding cassette subfamily C (CFTR/MRP) protein 1
LKLINKRKAMATFCRDPFWNTTLTWNTTQPELTQCFQDTVLIGIPCVFLWLVSPFWICWIVRGRGASQSQYPPPKRKVHTLIGKIVGTLVLIVSVAVKIYQRVEDFEQLFPSDVVGHGVLLATYLYNAFIVGLERKFNIHTSPVLFYFWVLHFFLSIPQFVQDVRYLVDVELEPTHMAAAIMSLPVLLIKIVLHSVSDRKKDESNTDAPEAKASHLSQVVFSWMDGLIWKGFKQPLVQSQLPSAPTHIDVGSNVKDFLGRWHKSISNVGISMIKRREEGRKDVSIWPVLLRTYGIRLFLGSIVGLVHHIITFANPLLLKLLIKHVEDKKEEEWKGYLYICVLLVCSILWTLTFHTFIQQIVIVAIQMRSSAVSAIYRKSLKLSNRARAKYTVGEITNYMSVDCQRILETVPFLPNLWSAPLNVVIAMYFLYQELGIATLGGVAVLFVLIPINVWGTKKGEDLQEQQLEAKDSRIKLMNEILPGMKVLKLYAWELPFMKRVNNVRDKEIGVLRYAAKLWALTNFTFACR